MTSQGLYGKPLPAKGSYEAGIACVLKSKQGACKVTKMRGKKHPYITQDGKDRESDPAQYVANFGDGCVAGFKYFLIPEGAQLTLTVRGHHGRRAKGKLQVSSDETFSRVSEAAWNGAKESRVSLRLPFQGTRALYVRFAGKGAVDLISLQFGNRKIPFAE